jgi:hypothetical protein
MSPRATAADPLAAFTKWLAKNPVEGDRVYGPLSVRYQVARYCDYVETNHWAGGDPLREASQREVALNAYGAYLEMFNTPAETISLIRESLDRFYAFLGIRDVAASRAGKARLPPNP